MKKNVAFKIMLPLVLVFILTVTVNITTTSCLQEARTVFDQISSVEGVSSEIAAVAGNTSKTVTSQLSRNGIVSSLQLLLVIVTTVITYICVVKPLKDTQKQLNLLIEHLEHDEGDLNERIKTKKEDEIGRLIFGINLFLNRLQIIMKSIQKHSDSLDNSSGKIISKVSESSNNMVNVSKETDALCQQMQVIQDTLDNITRDMELLNKSSDDISNSTVSGKSYAADMKERANNIKDLAMNSKSESEQITASLEEVLRRTMEGSKSVNSIQDLTEEILSIASQTNLIALNASIEAARAGEAGKGFAVVADEIRVLADNSRSTANSIQEISSSVVSCVEEMADASGKLLEFVNKNVLKDYDWFVTASIKYLNDADNLESIMGEFNNKSGELSHGSQNVHSGIGRISQAIEAENSTISNLSDVMHEMTFNMEEIQRCTAVNDGVSHDLKKEIAKFKAI